MERDGTAAVTKFEGGPRLLLTGATERFDFFCFFFWDYFCFWFDFNFDEDHYCIKALRGKHKRKGKSQNGRGNGRRAKEPKKIVDTRTVPGVATNSDTKILSKLEEWDTYWGLFNSIVHEQDLPPLRKFAYLLSTLAVEAKEVLNGFQFREENYEMAVQWL
ncbi:unnamed protein product [Heligmosomoides polygyrus]|uniref:RPAP3_C domain-containing protein n=1 Tax=Heligmosomoides polygyrus TaxID=6339 RepID=A0A183F645_HELPZ|nr:unnamed protein product [Heligmosomoides polygyrus]